MKRWGAYQFIICLLLACICFGCARAPKPSFYIRQDFDFSFIKKVAVLPFDNLTNEKFAAERIRRLVINQLLASGLMDVVVSGDVAAALKTAHVESATALPPQQIREIGKALNAQAVLAGSVERYEEPKSGAFDAPEVSLTLVMAETDSGSIVWSVNASTGGAGFGTRHFGARADTISEASEKVVKKAIGALYP
ncbi:MAG: hypothetical protein D4R73_10250 [Deltaproteobacteria bacterium]|jgi:TolB-like protein|nr:MAG: hypothetical protein D4R73_10250 [Deltaproteobacteria bacterium]